MPRILFRCTMDYFFCNLANNVIPRDLRKKFLDTSLSKWLPFFCLQSLVTPYETFIWAHNGQFVPFSFHFPLRFCPLKGEMLPHCALVSISSIIKYLLLWLSFYSTFACRVLKRCSFRLNHVKHDYEYFWSKKLLVKLYQNDMKLMWQRTKNARMRHKMN